MQKILQGIKRFQREIYPEQKSLFDQLSYGQNPEILFVTCSDSRIDPNLITGSLPGELFIVRNAGNLIPGNLHSNRGTDTIAAIEFAVTNFDIKHIVVCGHSDCGAMKGLLDPDLLNNTPHVQKWLQNADMPSPCQEQNASQGLIELTQKNIINQLANIKSYPFIMDRIEAGKLDSHGWLYDIKTGEITCYEEATGGFIPL